MKKKELNGVNEKTVLWVVFILLAILTIGSLFVMRESHFKIFSGEVCRDVPSNTSGQFYRICELKEIDEMIVCCVNVSNGYNDGSTLFCLPEENTEFFEITCESLSKEDLTTEWLELNTGGLIDNYYKFGNYTIEVWEQAK